MSFNISIKSSNTYRVIEYFQILVIIYCRFSLLNTKKLNLWSEITITKKPIIQLIILIAMSKLPSKQINVETTTTHITGKNFLSHLLGGLSLMYFKMLSSHSRHLCQTYRLELQLNNPGIMQSVLIVDR